MNDEDSKIPLPDTNETEDSRLDSLMGEEWQEKATGLGALLKSEREKRDVSIDQIAKLTRLRRHFIEALEAEDWKHLPAPVFVRGFIRSYARALNLDEAKVFDLYEGAAAPDMSVPQPVVAAPAGRRTPLWVVAAVALVGVVIGVYYWRDDRMLRPPKPLRTEERTSEKQASMVPPAQEGTTDGGKEALPTVEKAASDPDANLATFLDDISKPDDMRAEEGLTQFLTEAQTASGSAVSPSQTAESPAAPATDWLTLRGIVKTRTWVRIYVDDQAPKEFIFQPGSRPQWKAKQGFSVLVGNAAGIDFEFNGEEIRDLGNLGQVVRLNFPEGFVAPGLED